MEQPCTSSIRIVPPRPRSLLYPRLVVAATLDTTNADPTSRAAEARLCFRLEEPDPVPSEAVEMRTVSSLRQSVDCCGVMVRTGDLRRGRAEDSRCLTRRQLAERIGMPNRFMAIEAGSPTRMCTARILAEILSSASPTS